VDGLTKTVVTLALSVGAVAFGASLGRQVWSSGRASPLRPFLRHGLTIIAIAIYTATLPAYFLLPASYRHQATAALLFSYPGTLTRYILSVHLNPRLDSVPLGTLTANTLGTAVLGALHVLQNKSHAVSPVACGLLQGLADGYCGCLTTVSTFASEVLALEQRRRWFYIFVSFALAQAILTVILEPSFHAASVREQQVCRFTTG
jgi:CrcB protein